MKDHKVKFEYSTEDLEFTVNKHDLFDTFYSEITRLIKENARLRVEIADLKVENKALISTIKECKQKLNKKT